MMGQTRLQVRKAHLNYLFVFANVQYLPVVSEMFFTVSVPLQSLFFVQMQLYLITTLIATEISTHYSGLIPIFLSVVWLYLQCTAFDKLPYHNFTCYSIIRR